MKHQDQVALNPESSDRKQKKNPLAVLSHTYLNSRLLHENENTVFEGPVKIEDRASAQKGQILLKERYAVLCQSRLLLFKNEKESRKNQKGQALAVYPISQASFAIHDASPLTEYNFASRKAFQAKIDSLSNYTNFVRMSFHIGAHQRQVILNAQNNKSGRQQSRNTSLLNA